MKIDGDTRVEGDLTIMGGITSSALDASLATKQPAGDYVQSTSVYNIVQLTRAQYDALGTKVATTLYIVLDP